MPQRRAVSRGGKESFMTTSILITLGAIISVASAVPYIVAVLRGEARPRLVSWVVWAVLAGVMTVSAFLQGAVASGVMTSITFVACSTVTVLAWRQRTNDISRLDIACLVGAVFGIVSLVVFRSPLAALVISVLVDIVAFIPTFIHAWNSPEEESLACFSLGTVAGALSLSAVLVGTITPAALLYPIYSLVFNGAITLVIASGRSKYAFARSALVEE